MYIIISYKVCKKNPITCKLAHRLINFRSFSPQYNQFMYRLRWNWEIPI